jgi:chaperonin GroEL
MAVKKGIDKAVAKAVETLEGLSKKITKKEEMEQVATISANNNAVVGKQMADAFEKVGKDGVITIEEGKTSETVLEFVEGMQFDKGYISPYFAAGNPDLKCEMENPLILIYEKKLSNVREFLPLLEKVATAHKPLLIIAEDVESEALAMLVVNKLRGLLDICAVKAPGFGDRRKAMLGDIAVLTGGQFISEDLGIKLENVEVAQLGSADRVVVDKENCTIICEKKDKAREKAIQDRVGMIRTQMEQTESSYDKEKFSERLAKLVGGVAIIRVGAATEGEMKQLKDLVEDALHSTRAAVAEGIVPGGGVALMRCVPVVEELADKLKHDERIGAEIVARALTKPIRTIAENCGLDGAVIADEVANQKSATVGFNANNGEYVDMFKAGIIDPLVVTKTALTNAASIAGLMLTTEVMVTKIDEDDKKSRVAGSVA